MIWIDPNGGTFVFAVDGSPFLLRRAFPCGLFFPALPLGCIAIHTPPRELRVDIRGNKGGFALLSAEPNPVVWI